MYLLVKSISYSSLLFQQIFIQHLLYANGFKALGDQHCKKQAKKLVNNGDCKWVPFSMEFYAAKCEW